MVNLPTLDELAIRYDTDKSSKFHGYAHIYDSFFSAIREEQLLILEIGVLNGSSLWMWLDYFQRSIVIGIDIEPKTLGHPRFMFVQGDQGSNDFWNNFKTRVGAFDIIIDDGVHQAGPQLTSFHALFLSHLKPGGMYIIEDIHTAYPRQTPNELIIFLRELQDHLQWNGKSSWASVHMSLTEVSPSQLNAFEKTIHAIHFYKSLVIIEKRKEVI